MLISDQLITFVRIHLSAQPPSAWAKASSQRLTAITGHFTHAPPPPYDSRRIITWEGGRMTATAPSLGRPFLKFP